MTAVDGRLALQIGGPSDEDDDDHLEVIERQHINSFHSAVRPSSSAALSLDDNPLLVNGLIQRIEPHDEVFVDLEPKPAKLLQDYLIGERLGEGSYAKVKECLDQRTLARRAIKIVKLARLRRIPRGLENVQRETRLLRRLRHRNVIGLHDDFELELKFKRYLVLDYCACSLQELLDSAPPHKRLPLCQAHDYLVQLVDGLEYLHGQGVVHKDVKPGNLLLALDHTLKITDLGVAEELGRFDPLDTCTGGQGTPKFQPPEVAAGIAEHFRGAPVDLWAAGVTLYNLVSGQYPFDGENIYRLYANIGRQPLVMPTSIDVDAPLERLLGGLLDKRPDERLTVDGVRATDWFRKRHPQTLDRVPLPLRDGARLRPLSVLPALERLYDPAAASDADDGADSDGVFDDAGGPSSEHAAAAATAAPSQLKADNCRRKGNACVLQ